MPRDFKAMPFSQYYDGFHGPDPRTYMDKFGERAVRRLERISPRNPYNCDFSGLFQNTG